ncbi:hypothetical protein G6F70_007966 [Rhizopus microsporus]|uniref:Uncharacterized protein n=2 Tax=Rhizopus TaxID=4842 RepID=A0A367JCL0_RHIAZ|nr:hypothetical protein G6F71_007970 [Rhizopus microsporus]RCH87461.1 hypothetical protein CU097_009464 [Rhizopus azygosporus]KAG1195793.1 hypothetical protein G6F70_007966 [Rhizopus microsporus]KAG1207624.1 hypothetical protein G6F69_007892 [Rhizopus microsporus]KAG1228480.1 hypothetical protein G6F67_007790 [Rhizopus microsporus]
MSNIDQLKFWLEEEPAGREDDVYLPPDTPIVNPGPNTISLIHKKKTLLKHRCIARLKSYHYKQLEIIRKNVASTVQKEKLPRQSFTPPIEVITGRDYLAYFTQDILDCIDHLDKVKRDEVDPSKDPKVVQVNNGELFHERTEYASQLEKLFDSQCEEAENQYRTLYNIIIEGDDPKLHQKQT